MIEDDPYKGPHMGDAQGIARPTVADPKYLETVIARLADGTLWKFSRYFESAQYWSDPSEPEDVLLKQKEPTPAPPYDGPIDCHIAVKSALAAEEYELYDLSHDPMELTNQYNNPDLPGAAGGDGAPPGGAAYTEAAHSNERRRARPAGVLRVVGPGVGGAERG